MVYWSGERLMFLTRLHRGYNDPLYSMSYLVQISPYSRVAVYWVAYQ